MFQYTIIQGDQMKFSLFEKKISACNSFELIMFRNCTISLLGYGYTIHSLQHIVAFANENYLFPIDAFIYLCAYFQIDTK